MDLGAMVAGAIVGLAGYITGSLVTLWLMNDAFRPVAPTKLRPQNRSSVIVSDYVDGQPLFDKVN